MIKGIDVSRYQGKIDWNKVKQAGIKFAIAKCSQGESYKDLTYEENKKGAREVGILFGSYHYANAYDPINEADWYIQSIGDIKEKEILVLDWEKTHANPPIWCKKFLDRVKEKTGVIPFFYSYQAIVLSSDWKEVSKDYPLWEARYSAPDIGQMGTPPETGSWKEWTIWQYSSKGKIDGIVGNVDLDIAKDSLIISEENNMFKPGKFIRLSQQDSRWGWKPIGETKYLIKDWGCTITCIAMASTWFNCYKEPDWLAKNLRFTADAKVYWQSINEKTCFKFEWRFYKNETARIKEALKNDRKICLLQVYNKHWVVATNYLYTGYWTADPWTGTSKFYPNSAISGGSILYI